MTSSPGAPSSSASLKDGLAVDASIARELVRFARAHVVLRGLIGTAAAAIALTTRPDANHLLAGALAGAYVLVAIPIGVLSRPRTVHGLAAAGIALDLALLTVWPLVGTDPITAPYAFFGYVFVAIAAAGYLGYRGGLATLAVGGLLFWLIYLPLTGARVIPLDFAIVFSGVTIALVVILVAEVLIRQRRAGLLEAQVALRERAERTAELEELERIVEAARSFATATTRKELGARVLETLSRLIPHDASLFGVYDPPRNRLRNLAARVPDDGPPSQDEWRLDRGGIIAHVVRTAAPYLAADTAEDPLFIDGIGAFRSEVVVPVVAGGRVLAVLDLNRWEPRAFNDGHVRVLSVLATLVAGTLESLEQAEERERRLRAAERLQGVETRLLAATTPDEVHRIVVEAATNALRVPYAVLWLLDGDRVVLGADVVPPGFQRAEGDAFPIDAFPVVKQVRDSRRPQVQTALPEAPQPVSQRPRQLRAVAAAPVEMADQIVAVLVAGTPDPYGLSEEDLAALGPLARSTALALQSVRLLEETRRRGDRIAAASEFTRLLSTGRPFPTLWAELTPHLLGVVPCDRLVFVEVDLVRDLRRMFLLHPDGTIADRLADVPWEPLPAPQREGRVIAQQEVVLADRSDPAAQTPGDMLWTLGMESALIAPVIARGITRGVLAFASRTHGRFSAADVDLVRPFTEQLGVALENRELLRDVQVKAERIEASNRIARLLASTTDLTAAGNEIATIVRTQVPFDRATISMLEDETSVRTIVLYDPEFARADSDVRLPLADLRADSALRTGQAVLVGDLAAGVHGRIERILARRGYHALLSYPLVVGERVIGTLTLTSRQRNAYDATSVDALRPLAEQLAVSVQNTLLFQQVRQQAARLALLNRLTAIAQSSLELTELFPRFVEALAETGVEDGMLVLRRGSAYEVLYRTSSDGRLARVHTSEPQPLMDAVLRTNEPAIRDIDSEAVAPNGKRWMAERGLVSLAAFPIRVENRPLGAAYLFSHSRDGYGEPLVESLKPAMDQLAVAVDHALTYEEQLRAAERLATINRAAAILKSDLDLRASYPGFADEARKVIPFEGSAVWADEGGGGRLVRLLSEGPVGPTEANRLTLPPELVERLAAGAVIHNLEESGYPVDAGLISLGFRSRLTMPLVAKGELVGAWVLRSRTHNAYEPEDALLMQPLADQLALALVNAQLYLATQENARRLDAYRRIAEVLNSSVRLDDVYEELAALCHDVISFDWMRVIATREEGAHLVIRRAYTQAGSPLPAVGDLDGSAVAEVVRSLQPLLRGDIVADRRYPFDSAAVDAGVRSAMIVPLIANGQAVGTMIFVSTAAHAFSPASLGLVEPIAALLAAEIARANVFEELERHAITDPLTGIPNRRYFTTMLGAELARAARYHNPFAIAIMDLDRFKEVNDRLGHLTGDRVLRDIARALSASLRASDVLARYGGDEFVVLLPGQGLEQALIVADKLRATVAGLTAESPAPEIRSVSLSVGVAASPEHGADVETLLRAADEALYQAKRAGRDRVVVAGQAA